MQLNVDLDGKTVTLGDTTFDVDSDAALRWVKILNEHSGDWISSKDLIKFDKVLIGEVRPDRLKRLLPAGILELIESSTKICSRIK